MAQFRAVSVLIGFLLWTAVCIPIQVLFLATSQEGRRTFPQFYFRGVCAIFGVRVQTRGELKHGHPLLIAANHTSYWDIVVLGSLGPISFISKSEVASWPLFGFLAKIARTIFVERQRRAKTGEHRDMIQQRLAEGDTLVLFPEGTSSDGNRVLPFKSALMGAAQLPRQNTDTARPPILVQPVAVAYTRLHGLPMGRYYRPFFAWYGDMDMVPHLWEAAKMGPFDVDVHFYPPVTFGRFGTRREMASHCETVVSEGVGHALAGRPGLAGTIVTEGETPFDTGFATPMERA